MPVRVNEYSSAAWAKPKIGNDDPSKIVLQHDVGRLDVAVNHSLSMGGLQPGGDLQADPHDLPRLQRSVPFDQFLKRMAGNILHHQKRDVGSRLHVVDRDDMFVNDRCGSARFARKSLPGHAAAGQMRRKNLDGDRSIEFGIEPLENHPHPAGAEKLLDVVTADSPEHLRMRGRRQHDVERRTTTVCRVDGGRQRPGTACPVRIQLADGMCERLPAVVPPLIGARFPLQPSATRRARGDVRVDRQRQRLVNRAGEQFVKVELFAGDRFVHGPILVATPL